MAITNSRNTLQSFSFASFVSSDRDSLSHTALTLRLRQCWRKPPAHKAGQTDDQAASGVLLREGRVRLSALGRGGVDGRHDAHQIGEGGAQLVHGRIGQNGRRHGVVVLQSRLESEQALLNSVIVLFGGEDGGDNIDVLGIRLLVVIFIEADSPCPRTRSFERFPRAPPAAPSEAPCQSLQHYEYERDARGRYTAYFFQFTGASVDCTAFGLASTAPMTIRSAGTFRPSKSSRVWFFCSLIALTHSP